MGRMITTQNWAYDPTYKPPKWLGVSYPDYKQGYNPSYNWLLSTMTLQVITWEPKRDPRRPTCRFRKGSIYGYIYIYIHMHMCVYRLVWGMIRIRIRNRNSNFLEPKTLREGSYKQRSEEHNYTMNLEPQFWYSLSLSLSLYSIYIYICIPPYN